MKELELRPKFLSKMASSLNVSHDFLERMKNLTSEIQIFTEVEMTTLETLINETEVGGWLAVCVKGREDRREEGVSHIHGGVGGERRGM